MVHDAGDHPPQGQQAHTPKESPLVVTIPLILLAIPSIFIGWMTIEPVLFGGWLEDSIFVLEKNDVLKHGRKPRGGFGESQADPLRLRQG